MNMQGADRDRNIDAGPPANPASDLFVGTLEGLPACADDDETYEIWPKLMVIVMLQGAQHFAIDDQSFRIDAGPADVASPQALMLNVAAHARLRFINDSNVPLRKIQISAPRTWVERLVRSRGDRLPTLQDFLATHLSSFRFPLTIPSLAVAEQLMSPPPSLKGEMLSLFRKSRAMDLMLTACTDLLSVDADPAALPHLQTRRQCERIRDFILSHLDQPLTIGSIAHKTGASVSWVQRHFRDEFGMTVFDFIRIKRLEIARNALEGQGVTIAQAAYLAGYSDPANFSAAFKRTYGISPKLVRG